MKIPNLSGLAKVTKTFVLANRPEILFGASVTATAASVVLAAKGGYDARGMVEEEKIRRALDEGVLTNDEYLNFDTKVKAATPIPVKEKIQLTWLCYMPAAITTITAIGSTTGLHIVHVKDKKQMAAAGLAALEEVKKAAKEFEDDVKEAIEENAPKKTAEKIEGAIDEKQSVREALTVGGLYLVRDAQTGRDFHSTETKIKEAVVEMNRRLINRDVSLNAFYAWAGVPEIAKGEEYGWSAGLNIGLEWDDTHRADGAPIREFSFQPAPQAGFDDGGNT